MSKFLYNIINKIFVFRKYVICFFFLVKVFKMLYLLLFKVILLINKKGNDIFYSLV